MKIYILDDDIVLSKIVEKVVRRVFSTNQIIINSSIEEFNAQTLDEKGIYLLDHNLPDGKGIDVCKRISKRYPNSYIILITGEMDEEYLNEVVQAGAMDFIQKPFSIPNLQVRLILAKHFSKSREKQEQGEKIVDTITNLIPQSICIHDENGEVTYASNFAKNFFGNILLNKSFDFFSSCEIPKMDKIEGEFEWTFMKNNHKHWLNTKYYLLPGEEKKFLTITEDVTTNYKYNELLNLISNFQITSDLSDFKKLTESISHIIEVKTWLAIKIKKESYIISSSEKEDEIVQSFIRENLFSTTFLYEWETLNLNNENLQFYKVIENNNNLAVFLVFELNSPIKNPLFSAAMIILKEKINKFLQI